MASTNNITGDSLTTGAASTEYKEGHNRIFGEREPWYVRRDREAAEAASKTAEALNDNANPAAE